MHIAHIKESKTVTVPVELTSKHTRKSESVTVAVVLTSKQIKKSKSVSVPVELTQKHMEKAIRMVDSDWIFDTPDSEKTYSLNSALSKVTEQYSTLPVNTLFVNAGIIKDRVPQPFMFENEFAGEKSNRKGKRPIYFITPKGIDFLENVLWCLRHEIDTAIFKK